MPGFAASPADERGTLIAHLEQQHSIAHHVTFGLTDEQLALTPARSSLSIGGLVRHLTSMESMWLARAAAAPEAIDLSGTQIRYGEDFLVPPGTTVASLLATYDETLATSVRIIRDAPDLSASVPLPPAPWFEGHDAWTVRGVVNHVLTETARHLGHADLIREEIDGATWYELMAAAEGWPATTWLTPWARPTA